MPSRAMARNLAAIIIANGGGVDKDLAEAQAKWDAVPKKRKENLERFLESHRKNPLGPTLK